jgi:hypothetical protein
MHLGVLNRVIFLKCNRKHKSYPLFNINTNSGHPCVVHREPSIMVLSVNKSMSIIVPFWDGDSNSIQLLLDCPVNYTIFSSSQVLILMDQQMRERERGEGWKTTVLECSGFPWLCFGFCCRSNGDVFLGEKLTRKRCL